MVFGWLFGKKKTVEQPPVAAKPAVQPPVKHPIQQEHKKEQKVDKQQKQHKQEVQRVQLEDEWIYDYLLQYLTSPIWKVPIYEFLDDNCMTFDDDEENKFSYTVIHNKFKAMIESMIECLMSEIGVDETKLLQYIEIGLKSSHHRKVFEQLLIVDNFLVFKKLMIKRNKELELEAMKELMKDEKDILPEDNEKLNLATLQAERAEIDHAIQMSVAAEEEMKKMQQMEEEDLMKVLEMSKITFQKEEMSRSKIEETPVPDQTKFVHTEPEVEKKAPAHLPVIEQAPVVEKKVVPEPTKIDQVQKKVLSEPTKIDQAQKKPVEKVVEPEEQKQPEIAFKPISKLPVLKPVSSLPPLVDKKFEKPVEDLLQDRAQLLQKLDNYKAVEEKLRNQQVVETEEVVEKKEESLEERKQRLLAQRELLRKKKQQQREQELKDYKETDEKGKKALSSQPSLLMSDSVIGGESSSVNTQELQKRQNLMAKIKQNM